MKVELIRAAVAPTAGGAATYVDDVVAAIDSLAGSTHEFFVLSWEAAPAGLKNIRWILLRRSTAERLRAKFSHVWQSFVAKCRGEVPPPHPFEAMVTAVRRDLGIQCALVTQPVFSAIRDVPYIATVWDLEHRNQPIFPEVSTGGEYERREQTFSTYLRKAARVVVGTEVGKEQVERFYGLPAERIAVIPMPTPSFALADDQAGTRPGAIPAELGGAYIFYPAQFWPHKNHVTLLRALAALKRDHGRRLPLVLTGSDKGNRSFVESTAAALGVADQVHFPGFVSREELIWLYRNALALGYLSFFGPDNLPPLEAFALGCPVVAGRQAGAAEQLGDAALLVDPWDEQAVAAAFLRIASDKSFRASLILLGKERAAASSARCYGEKLGSLLDEVDRYRRCWP